MSKRTGLSVLAGMIASLLVAGIAFAYWTADGTGSGDAGVGTDSGVSIGSVTFSGDLFPGSAVDVSFAITNDSADAPVRVDEVVADETDHVNGIQIDKAVGAVGDCLPAWFTYSGATVDHELAASEVHDVTAGGTLSMSNAAVVQDGCKDATVTLHLKTDNSAIDA